jgi:hypothetical protein
MRPVPGGARLAGRTRTRPDGARACLAVVDTNADLGVTWILPVDRITEVRVLDPYFHH